jgi:hypothetical protein
LRPLPKRVAVPMVRVLFLAALFVLTPFVVASLPIGCSSSSNANATDGGVDGTDEFDAPHGQVYLANLSVTSSSGAIALAPTFSPGTTDYYILCDEGPNAVTVSMTASSGATSQLEQPTPASPKLAEQTLHVSVNANQAVVAAAWQGQMSVEYWVRCLPPDFPKFRATAYPQNGTPPPGYYLMGTETPAPGGVGYAMVLDINGVPVWYAAQPQNGIFNSTTGAFDVDSPAPGSISYISWPSTNASFPFQIFGLSPASTTTIYAKNYALDPHELKKAANGDYYIFTDQIETGVNLTGYDMMLSDGGVKDWGPDQSILPCDVLEVNSSGDKEWEWVATDHLDAVMDNTLVGYEAGPDGSGYPDPFHCNTVDIDPANGNILVSSRHEDSIFYIDRQTSKIVWKMGGKTYVNPADGATYVPVADPFYRQHDTRLLPGWDSTKCGGTGQISMYDDHSFEPGYARGIVYNVNVGVGAGCPAAGATVAWQYDGPNWADQMGGFRILPDGSRTIGWGVVSWSLPGGGQPVLSEVSEAGKPLFEWSFTDGTFSFRVIKVPSSQLTLEVLRQAVSASN